MKPSGSPLDRRYELVGKASASGKGDDGGGSDFNGSFTEEQHIRSSMLTASKIIRLPESKAPTAAQEGMLRHSESVAIEASISKFRDESEGPGSGSGSGNGHNHDEGTSLLQTDHKSKSFREAELSVIRRALEEIDKVANKRIRDGFSEINFTLGVLNTIVVVYVWGVYPQHFWLMYLFEGVFLITAKFRSFITAKPLNNVLYFLDYCWVMNLLALVILVVFVLDAVINRPMQEYRHKEIFMAAVGTACGPLLGACLILPFVCVLFHDINTLADLFIHIFPPMVVYTLRWNVSEIREAWPNIFFLDYMQDVTFLPKEGQSFFMLDTIAGNTVAVYLGWLLLYTIWLLAIGMDLPRYDRRTADGRLIIPKYDTVFHSLMRGGLYIVFGSTFWGRPKSISVAHMETNNFEKRDLFLYMALHIIMAILSIFLLGWPCWSSKAIHVLFLILVTVISVYRGALRYTYYTTAMYGKTIRKQFAHLIDKENEKSVV